MNFIQDAFKLLDGGSRWTKGSWIVDREGKASFNIE